MLTSTDFERLRSRFHGELLRPGDTGYDAARAVFNAMIDRRPGLIVRARRTADVVAAVELAAARDLPVSVRGGGHDAGHAVADGGLMLDLSGMKRIHVDPASRTVRADPGVTWGELDRENEAHGLFMPGGAVSSTSIAGLTLGGGIGWLSRRFGLVCDHLRSADIVTADGRFLTADAEAHPDLFWGLRGGGAHFGVVTSFEYRLHPIEPILAGPLFHPLERGADALRFCRAVHRSAPDALTVHVAFDRAPDGRPAAILLPMHVGPIEQGARAIEPIRRFAAPIADHVRAVPYPTLQSMLDAAAPWGLFNCWKTSYLRALDDAAIEVITSFAARAPSPLATVVVEHVGGAIRRAAAVDAAFCRRDVAYNLLIMAKWRRPEETEANVRWARDFWSAMQPHAIAVPDTRNRARLGALKRAYDPTNRFRHNQNVAA
jgi:FAD/FMN-containing dehydrogenase